MSDEQKILDRIAADAKAEADAVLAKAQEEADALIAAAQAKADKELAVLLKAADEEAAKAAAKTVSGAEMTAKKNILSTKQALLEETIEAAKEKLLHLNEADYLKTLAAMLAQAQIREGEILLSPTDKARFGDALAKEGFPIGEETRDIAGGFIVKCGDVEYNYSFASILAIQREEMESIAAGILFG